MEQQRFTLSDPKPQNSLLYRKKQWFRGRKLGKGGYSTVYLAFFPSPDPLYFRDFPKITAVKSSHLGVANELYWERKLYNALRGCPFLVECFGDDVTVEDENGNATFNIFLEYAAGGSLADLIKSSKSLLEPQASRFTRSILGGIERIHREGLVHCDVKLENVLLFGEGGEIVAKVADLGVAKRAVESEERSLRGTMIYWAPEMAKDGVQGQPSDIWALGCILVWMLTGTSPWGDLSYLTKLERKNLIAMGSPRLPCGVFSEAAESFVNECLRRDPAERPTAAELLRHPFLAEERTRAVDTLHTRASNIFRIFSSCMSFKK